MRLRQVQLTTPIDQGQRVFVVGPSGAGKTTVLSSLRGRPGADLDLIGYRTNPGDWKEWHIPHGAFRLAAALSTHVVLVGADSHSDQLIDAARAVGFHVVALIPSPDRIAAQRTARGDSQIKVSESDVAHRSWIDRASRYDLPVYRSSERLAEFLNTGRPAPVPTLRY